MTIAPRIKQLVVGITLVSIAAFAQAAERRDGSWQEPSPSHGSVAAAKRARFGIGGHVTGLYPGATRPLRLTVRNPNRFPITVRSVRASVRSTTPACPAKSIKVAKFKGNKRVAPRGRAKIKVKVTMRPTAPAACAGAKYRLTYRGKAIYR